MPLADRPRSPERAALAVAVERHKAATDRLDRLQKALEDERESSFQLFLICEQAEKALSEVQERAPADRVKVLLGEAPAPAEEDTVAAAQRRFDAARAEREQAQGAIGDLAAAIGQTEQKANFAAQERNKALAAVIAADPALRRLLAAYDAARARVAALSETLNFLGPDVLRGEHQHWYALNRELPPTRPVLPQWQAAITALAGAAGRGRAASDAVTDRRDENQTPA
jgi:chromosome segregation ATPase